MHFIQIILAARVFLSAHTDQFLAECQTRLPCCRDLSVRGIAWQGSLGKVFAPAVRANPFYYIGLKAMGFSTSKFLKGLFMGRHPATAEQPSYKDHVARPILQADPFREFSWKNENVLILGQENGLSALAKDLSAHGASVSFRFLTQLQDLYQLSLEQYSIAIMTDGSNGQQFDVVDVGGILRRADPKLTVVWASERFRLSMVADAVDDRFCDVQLALPASSVHLEVFLRSSPP